MKKRKKKLKKKVRNTFRNTIILIFLLLAGIFGYYTYIYNTDLVLKPNINKDYYTFSDFGYIVPISKTDFNNDGIDDSTQIFEGEKKYAELNPKYKSDYYENGYPPVEKEGVCTDLIWYSLKNAGYDLKNMIAKDIENTKKEEIYGITNPDSNIDFRRVANQEIFFQRYAEILDTDYNQIGEFLPGDILTFDNSDHIAMVSDKLNKKGIPYLIQNRDETQKQKEEDRLEITDMKVTGHYRFIYTKKLQKLIDQL